MELNNILGKIQQINDRYRTLKLGDTHTQSEILRDLSCSFNDLITHKIDARERWLDAYNSYKGSNASKERYADSEVREYDIIKDLMTALKMQKESVVSTLSANK
jgi:hypothetical protein